MVSIEWCCGVGRGSPGLGVKWLCCTRASGVSGNSNKEPPSSKRRPYRGLSCLTGEQAGLQDWMSDGVPAAWSIFFWGKPRHCAYCLLLVACRASCSEDVVPPIRETCDDIQVDCPPSAFRLPPSVVVIVEYKIQSAPRAKERRGGVRGQVKQQGRQVWWERPCTGYCKNRGKEVQIRFNKKVCRLILHTCICSGSSR